MYVLSWVSICLSESARYIRCVGSLLMSTPVARLGDEAFAQTDVSGAMSARMCSQASGIVRDT